MKNLVLQAALGYAALGYGVFPLRAGDKRPATEHGFLDATLDEEQITRWWRAEPQLNVAIRTEGLLVVDVDGEANPWLAYSEERVKEFLSSPMAVTPGGGVHYWFRQPEGRRWTNSIGKLALKVDTRACGGYVAVPPSRRGDKTYAWVSDAELEAGPEELPLTPDWLTDALDEIQEGRCYQSLHSGYEGAEIPEGTRNSVLASIGGTLRRHGLDESAIAAALLETNRKRCHPPLSEDEVQRVAASVSRYEPDQVATILAEGQADGAAFTGEGPEEPEDPGGFPEDLLEVPGFVGKVAEYTLRTSPRRQPVFALAGALTLLSVLTGRKIRDPSNIRTNLYAIVVGRSGSGKDRTRQVSKEILIEAGAEDLLGPEEIQSGTGLLAAVRPRPACLIQPDEIGRLLMTVQNPRSSPHLYSIVSNLLKLYGSAGGSFRAGGYADPAKCYTINQPHVSFLGTTVIEAFVKALTTEEVTGGFLSRLLVFQSVQIPDIQDVEWCAIPPGVVEEAQFWHDLRPGGGNLSSENPQPRVIPYTGAARAELGDFQRYCDGLWRQKTPGSDIWSRTGEKARKLALLRAASEYGPEVAEIDEQAVRWAARLAEYTTRFMLRTASDWVADSLWEATTKRLLRVLKKHAPLSWAELTRKTHYWLRKRDRQEIIDELVTGGLVKVTKKKTKGRPASLIELTVSSSRAVEESDEAKEV